MATPLGRLLDPEFISRDYFPTALDLLTQQREYLAERARVLLAREGPDLPEAKVRHLRWLAAGQPYDAYAMTLHGTYLSAGPKPKQQQMLDETG